MAILASTAGAQISVPSRRSRVYRPSKAIRLIHLATQRRKREAASGASLSTTFHVPSSPKDRSRTQSTSSRMQAETGQLPDIVTRLDPIFAERSPAWMSHQSLQAFLDHSRAQLLNFLPPKNQLHERMISSKTGVLKPDQVTAIPGTPRMACSDTEPDVKFNMCNRRQKWTVGVLRGKAARDRGWRRYKPKGKKSHSDTGTDNAVWCLERDILVKLWGRLLQLKDDVTNAAEEDILRQKALGDAGSAVTAEPNAVPGNEPMANETEVDAAPHNEKGEDIAPSGPALPTDAFMIPPPTPPTPPTPPRSIIKPTTPPVSATVLSEKEYHRLRKKMKSLRKKYELMFVLKEENSRSSRRNKKKRKASTLDDLQGIAEAETEDEELVQDAESTAADHFVSPPQHSNGNQVSGDRDIVATALLTIKMLESDETSGKNGSKPGDSKRLRLLLFGRGRDPGAPDTPQVDEYGDTVMSDADSDVEELSL